MCPGFSHETITTFCFIYSIPLETPIWSVLSLSHSHSFRTLWGLFPHPMSANNILPNSHCSSPQSSSPLIIKQRDPLIGCLVLTGEKSPDNLECRLIAADLSSPLRYGVWSWLSFWVLGHKKWKVKVQGWHRSSLCPHPRPCLPGLLSGLLDLCRDNELEQ